MWYRDTVTPCGHGVSHPAPRWWCPVRTKVVGGRRRKHLKPQITEHVKPGSTVYTDELKSYDGLSEDYVHSVIRHAESYVDGRVHVNGCENFWALLKRAIKGTYVSVEPFHLHRYLDEESYRFNTREQTDGQRFTDVLKNVTDRRVTFDELIGRADATA